MTKPNNPQSCGIDLAKFLLAFAVVAIHTNPLANCKNGFAVTFLENLMDLAVPFFFLATGYLLGGRIWAGQDAVGVLFHRLKKVTQLYLIWTAAYMPLSIWHSIRIREPLRQAGIHFLQGLLFTGEQHNAWHLWYLLATVYGLLVLLLLARRTITVPKLLAVSLTAFALSGAVNWVANTGWHPAAIPQKIVLHTIVSGRILKGISRIPVGICLSRKRLPGSVSVFLLVGCFALRCLPSSAAVQSVLQLGMAVGLLGIVTTLPLKKRPVYRSLRSASTIIYLIHMYVWTGFCLLVYGEMAQGLISFLAVSVISCLAASLWQAVQRRKESHESRLSN